jgi:hypothetical protein
LGPRKRQRFNVFAEALRKMEEKLKSIASDHIADCDAVLKLCKAGKIFDLPEAVEYAHSAAEPRASELRKCTNRKGHLEATPTKSVQLPFLLGSGTVLSTSGGGNTLSERGKQR